MTRKIKCRSCGERFDPDCLGGYVDGIGDCCDGCYWDKAFECCACHDHDAAESCQKSMLVVAGKVDFLCAGTAKRGIYRVVNLPYYGGPIIGSGWLFDDALEFLAPLPPGIDTDGYPCGHLCRGCQAIVLSDQGKSEREIIRSRIAAFNAPAWRRRHRYKTPIRFRVGSRVRHGRDECVVVGHSRNGLDNPGAYVVPVRRGLVGLYSTWVGGEENLTAMKEER